MAPKHRQSTKEKTKPTKQPKSKPGDQFTTTTFVNVVEEALRNFHDLTWLGDQSPLASPYFLAEGLDGAATDATARGRAVQTLLTNVCTELRTEQAKWGELWAELLRLAYFTRPDLSVQQIVMRLNTSEAAYHRHRKSAISHLAHLLVQTAKPALRLEQPPRAEILVGRAGELLQLEQDLRQGHAVAVTGVGGVGKSTLVAHVARAVAPATTFWYTIAPGLNDQPNTLLFALGWFLHNQGVSTLWLQLLADRGAIGETLAVNLLRHDLAQLPPNQTLLCFDEIDLLRPAEIEGHTRLMALIEQLRGQMPLVLIGQKPILDADLHLPLVGLPPVAMHELLAARHLLLDHATIGELVQRTQGNPRLLELFAAYVQAHQRTGHGAVDLLADFAQEPSLELLLRRIWRHLNETEMALLELLAVFRNPAPRAAWSDHAQQQALDQLITWRLVQQHGQAEITLLPALRETIATTLLLPEAKELLHLEAAQLRAQYAQFTAAAYHYLHGDAANLALHLLYGEREQVINQGQAEAALTVLKQISPRRLAAAEQEVLSLLRAELQKLLGHYDDARQSLRNVYWRIPFLQAQAWRLEGDIAELRGETATALQAYQAGLATVEQWLTQAADFHRDLGYLHLLATDTAKAETELLRVRHEAANLEGALHEVRGELDKAATAYEEAYCHAQAAGYFYGEANTHNNLGRIYAWQRQLPAAERHLQEAQRFFRATGRLNKLASATYNLALAQRLAAQYKAALDPGEEALALFTQLGEEYGMVVTWQILAECLLELGELARAEQSVTEALARERTGSLPDHLRTLGEIRLRQGALSEAEALIQQSLALAQANEDQILEAYAWRALGEVYLAGSNPEQMQAFDKAKAIFLRQNLSAELETIPVR